jgi:hypothetical protein
LPGYTDPIFANIIGQPAPPGSGNNNGHPPVIVSPQKYDASKYRYLKITDNLSVEMQKEVTRH